MILGKLVSFFFVIGIMGLSSQTVNAARFSFKQSGFNGSVLYFDSSEGENHVVNGGLVTGSFTAKDTAGKLDENGLSIPDGMITVCNHRYCDDNVVYDEVVNFSIHFSGNEMFDSFNQLNNPSSAFYPYLQYLNLDPKANLLKISYSDFYSAFGYRGESESDHDKGEVLFDNGKFFFSSATQDSLHVSQVPLPSAFGLFAIGVSAMIVLSRRRANKGFSA